MITEEWLKSPIGILFKILLYPVGMALFLATCIIVAIVALIEIVPYLVISLITNKWRKTSITAWVWKVLYYGVLEFVSSIVDGDRDKIIYPTSKVPKCRYRRKLSLESVYDPHYRGNWVWECVHREDGKLTHPAKKLLAPSTKQWFRRYSHKLKAGLCVYDYFLRGALVDKEQFKDCCYFDFNAYHKAINDKLREGCLDLKKPESLTLRQWLKSGRSGQAIEGSLK